MKTDLSSFSYLEPFLPQATVHLISRLVFGTGVGIIGAAGIDALGDGYMNPETPSIGGFFGAAGGLTAVGVEYTRLRDMLGVFENSKSQYNNPLFRPNLFDDGSGKSY